MAVDYYLKVGTDVTGESQTENFAGQLIIQSWSYGGSNHSTVSGTGDSGAGKVDLSDMNVMFEFDKASITLFQGLCIGKHYPTATLSALKAGGNNQAYMIVTMTEVFITSLQFSASSEVPTCSMSLTYAHISFEYKTQDKEGTLTSAGTATWDRTTNKADK